MTDQHQDKTKKQPSLLSSPSAAEIASTRTLFTDEHIDALSRKVGGGDKVKRPVDKFPDPISVPYAKLTPMFFQNDDSDNDDSTENNNNNNNNVWTVHGSFTVIPYIFSTSLTMTIVRDLRDNDSLTIFNAFRCSPEIEQEILQLGTIRHVVKLGQFHGDADAYYVTAPQFAAGTGTGTGSEIDGSSDNTTTQQKADRPKLWTFEGGSVAEGLVADEILSDTNVPIAGSKVYNMTGHPFPEGVMTVPYASRDNNSSSNTKNLLIACDSLVHIVDLTFMTYSSRFIMWLMGLDMQSKDGIPKPAPLWCKTTVDIMGLDTVKKWYQDIIMEMDWDCFVGAHGTLTKTDPKDRQTIMDGIQTQLERNVLAAKKKKNKDSTTTD